MGVICVNVEGLGGFGVINAKGVEAWELMTNNIL